MTTIPEIIYPTTTVRRSVYFIAAIVLSGCTMIPPYERPALPVAGHYPGIDGSSDTPSGTDIAWWNFFTDRSLRQLITLALANNRDLRVAALNVEQSQAQYRISRSAVVPEVDGGGSYNRAHASGMTSASWNANVQTTAYEVDFFGRVRSLNRQALENYFATSEAQRLLCSIANSLIARSPTVSMFAATYSVGCRRWMNAILLITSLLAMLMVQIWLFWCACMPVEVLSPLSRALACGGLQEQSCGVLR